MTRGCFGYKLLNGCGTGGGGGGGSVTSVGLDSDTFLAVVTDTTNPITSTGTFTLEYGSFLPVEHGGTNYGTNGSKGDVLINNGSDAYVPLTVGSNGQVLTADSGAPLGATWTDVSGTGTVTSVGLTVTDGVAPFTIASVDSTTTNPITGSGVFELQYSGTPLPVVYGGTNYNVDGAKGDVLVNDGSSHYKPLDVGTNGQVLSANSLEPLGLEWIDPPAEGVTSVGLSVTSGGAPFTIASVSSTTTNPITSTGTFDIEYSGVPLPVIYGGTNYNVDGSKGDLLVNNSLSQYVPLPVGSDGTLLSANSAQPLGLQWITQGSIVTNISVFQVHTTFVQNPVSDVKIIWNETPVVDNQNNWDPINNWYTISSTGFYNINAQVTLNTSFDGYTGTISIVVNGSTTLQSSDIVQPAISDQLVLNINYNASLSAGDTVQINVSNPSLTNTGIVTTTSSNYFQLFSIGGGTGPSGAFTITDTNTFTAMSLSITNSFSGALLSFSYSGTPVPVTSGGTNFSSYVKGNLLVGNASTTLGKLSVGSNNQILVADSSQSLGLKWTDVIAPTTINNTTINNSTINSSTVTNTTVNGGTINNTTINNPILNEATLTGGTILTTGTSITTGTRNLPILSGEFAAFCTILGYSATSFLGIPISISGAGNGHTSTANAFGFQILIGGEFSFAENHNDYYTISMDISPYFAYWRPDWVAFQYVWQATGTCQIANGFGQIGYVAASVNTNTLYLIFPQSFANNIGTNFISGQIQIYTPEL